MDMDQNQQNSILHHIKRTFLIGLAVFAPFFITFWLLSIVIVFFAGFLSKPISFFMSTEFAAKPSVEVLIFTVSFFLSIALIYLVGLLSATFAGSHLISIGERILKRLPITKFFYGTAKEVVSILAKPKQDAFKKVVLVQWPRKDTWGLAFFTGITRTSANEVLLNIFLPCVPPTTGFIMMFRPDEVLLTPLTVSEGSRFIFSFGVLNLPAMETRPFPLEEYLAERKAAENVTRLVSQ